MNVVCSKVVLISKCVFSPPIYVRRSDHLCHSLMEKREDTVRTWESSSVHSFPVVTCVQRARQSKTTISLTSPDCYLGRQHHQVNMEAR